VNTLDEVKPNGLVPMVLYSCRKCGRRFTCEAPQHEIKPMGCPYCHQAKAPAVAPERPKAGSGVSRGIRSSSVKPKVGSGVSRGVGSSSVRPKVGSGVSRAACPHRSGTSAPAVQGKSGPGRGWLVSGVAIGAIGAATAALLLFVVFPVGQEKTQSVKDDASSTAVQAAGGASALSTGEQSGEMVLDAERKAQVAFAKLEAKLKQLPSNDTARRNALCEAFLRQHGTTIVASRVRVQMNAKGR